MLVWVSSWGSSRLAPVSVAIDQLLCLPGAVDARKRLLMQQRLEAVARRDPAQGLHQQHLVVGRDMAGLEEGRDLELERRHLVVTGLDRHAEPPELGLHLGHEREDPGRDRAEVMVLELLSLGRAGAEHGPLARHQVGTLVEELAVDQEVLLLRTHRRE